METSHSEIVDYWSHHQDECGLSVDWAEAEKLCWRCAHKRNLQRCHIIPHSLGGKDVPSNLVLLCAQCHAEAPNVADPDFMWVWLRAHAVPFYGTYWQARGVREYEFIFGEKLQSGINDPEKFMEQLPSILEDIYPKTSTHWGQGKINPATWAWVMRQAYLKAEGNA